MDVDEIEIPIAPLRHLPNLPILPSHKQRVLPPPAPAPSMPSFDSILGGGGGGGGSSSASSSKAGPPMSMPTHLVSEDLQLSESSGSESD
jgi:hypothetical protein